MAAVKIPPTSSRERFARGPEPAPPPELEPAPAPAPTAEPTGDDQVTQLTARLHKLTQENQALRRAVADLEVTVRTQAKLIP